jgi:hypothetical protein
MPFKRSNKNKGVRNVLRFFKEHPNKDFIGMCEEYIQKLRKLVDECEQLFNNREWLLPLCHASLQG